MSLHCVISNNNISGGFLSGFIESSVEMPNDRLNGVCIVHYGGEHSKCEMTVTLVNGKREGDALIVNDGMPYLKLHYERGLLVGVVERMNESGSVELRGHLVNGIEDGLFVEYDNDKVMWIGYYRNGQRYSEVRSRVVRNDNLENDSGEFYELDENGKVTQLCLYVNGVRSRVIQKFNGEVMTEYDENERRVYEGGFRGDVENGFVRNGYGKEYRMVGGFRKFISCIRSSLLCCRMEETQRELITETNQEEVIEGVWCNGVLVNAVVIPSSLTSNPQTIEELKIENDSYNHSSVTELKLRGLVRLKQIVIGDDCFGSVRVFELDGLGELESVEIGKKSLTIEKDYSTADYSKQTDGACRIVNCPKLKSIQIGDFSFCDYHSFELSNLPSLQSIDIGSWCFCWAPSFSLTGLID